MGDLEIEIAWWESGGAAFGPLIDYILVWSDTKEILAVEGLKSSDPKFRHSNVSLFFG